MRNAHGRLKGKVAIITGGAQGIGASIARLFSSEGANVVVADIADAPGRALAEELASAGGRALFAPLDVRSEEAWDECAHATVRAFGAVHVLVNNAGRLARSTVLDQSLEGWNDVFGVNVTGAFLGIKRMAPEIAAAGGGAIVNMCSIVGIMPSRFAAYSASKWALRGLTRSAALELVSSKIRVNNICPGMVATEMTKDAAPGVERLTAMGRLGDTDEIAQAALFLASEASSYVTGADISVDGGLSIGVFR